MFQSQRFSKIVSSFVPVLFVAVVAWTIPSAGAQQRAANAKLTNTSSAPQPSTGDEPPFRDYKGVQIGMSADEARKKLGSPQDKSPQQDFYTFSDNESAQVYYDAQQKVSAIAITYMGETKAAPTAQAVFGTTVETNADGSVYKREQYRKAGYWLSYSRTVGDSSMVAVTIQKIP